MPTSVMVVLGIILLGIAFLLFLVIRSFNTARNNLKVSAAQREIRIERWYKVGSQRRRDRVRSQLTVPRPGEAASDERYLWVTGLAPVRLWFLLLPSLVAVPLVIFLRLRAADLYQHPYDFNPTRAQDFEPIHLNRLGAFGLNVTAWVLLIAAVGWAVTMFLKWSSEFLVLSTYRVTHFHIHPAWAYWMKNKRDKIELSDITHAGDRRSALLADAFHYATITLDTPGKGDDQAFNEVAFIPNGTLRAAEIDELQQAAIAPGERSETDRVIEELRDINKKLSRLPYSQSTTPEVPTSGPTPEIYPDDGDDLSPAEDEAEASS